MSRLPPVHRARSHVELLDALATSSRHTFVDKSQPWDPTRVSREELLDLGAGVLDCFALALHVMWTYQEAWAEEGFLETARIDASAYRLLGHIGYRPSTGTAATGLQHFRCKQGASTTLPPGVQVRAKAEGEQQAALFETLHAVDVSAALNEVRPLLPNGEGTSISATGSIAAAFPGEFGSGDEILTPFADTGTMADQLEDRLNAVRAGSAAQRRAARARQKARQLTEVLATLEDAGLDEGCSAEFQQLCDQLCEAQEIANQVAEAGLPTPLSESQDILLGQLHGLKARQPDALAALEEILGRNEDEEREEWSRRLDLMVAFLDSLVAGILQEARDNLVRLNGATALSRLDQAMSDPRGTALGVEDVGFAPPGTDALYLLPFTVDEELGPQTHSELIKPGTWFVVGEDTTRVDGDGNSTTQRRWREPIQVLTVRDEIPEGQGRRMTRITFRPPLQRRYALHRTALLGNMALVSHGEAVEEALSLESDGRTLVMSRSPLTWLRDIRAPEGRRPECELTVAERDWARVDDLSTAAAVDAVFAVVSTATGGAVAVVGDGIEGAPIPAGSKIVLRYRIGLGTDGNRASGLIKELATSHAALDSTFNPLPTTGGADAEESTLAFARANAGINALDRAVSVEDVQSLALSFDNVRRARVFRDPVRRRERLTVVVSGVEGEGLGNADLAELRAFLASRLPPGMSVSLENRRPVAIRTALNLYITPGADPLAVVAAVRQRLGVDPADVPGLLDPSRTDIGTDVRLSDIYGALAGIDDLESSFIELFYRADAEASRSETVQIQDREIAHWAPPIPETAPVEIAWQEARDQ